MLQDHRRARAFGINPGNVSQVIEARSQLFQSVYPAITQLCHSQFNIPRTSCLETLWNLWLPLAIQLVAHRKALDRPLVQGILGSQGTGKTTLGVILTLILGHLGYPTLSFSLDDLYKPYAERQRLQQEDPRLVWRGPPGTHDIQLGIQVLDQLRSGRKVPIQIPRFDKSAQAGAGDRTDPETVSAVEIVLFEGWFVGARPIDPAGFITAPPPILTAADRAFAQDMNAKLHDYLPLWQRLDRLLMLYLLDYRLSKQWRRQAEHQAIATGKAGMPDAEIDQFVEYFWRALHPNLFIKPLTEDPRSVDLVIEIKPDHSPGAVYQPC
jgi:D-glycerate 3-kinase